MILRSLAYVTAGLSLVLLLAGMGGAFYLQRWAASPLPMERALTIEFVPGASLHSLSRDLQEAGVLEHPWLLRLFARSADLGTRLQSGEYEIPVGETPAGLLRRLHRGDVVQHRLRIVEGSQVRGLLRQVLDDPRLARLHEGALLARVRDRVCYNTLGVESVANLEGLFAPETYAFTRRIAPDDLLVRAHERLCTQLQSLWQAHPNMFANAYEALILASIIEKETARDEDRSNVSQVFHNRLQRNMRLQTDPTVIYALGESFDGDIRRRDLQVDSPYNTYRVKGLPPTPIASVSLASLQAAFQPSDGTLLYFVARGDGTTQFSTTLEEHNAAVRRFQLGQSG